MSKTTKPKQAPEPEFSKEGYPTGRTCTVLRKWPSEDALGALKFMQAAWNYDDYVTNTLKPEEAKIVGADDGDLYFRFATGGWSGNEELISAFEYNRLCWAFTWCASVRGGLHIFRVTKKA